MHLELIVLLQSKKKIIVKFISSKSKVMSEKKLTTVVLRILL